MSLVRATIAGVFLSLLVSPAPAADSKSAPAEPGSAGQQPAGDDWPAFLGPLGTGVTRDTGIVDRWPETGPPLLWSKPLDDGYAAPSVLGGKLVVFSGSRGQEIVECVRAGDGKPIWKFDYFAVAGTPMYGDGPRCTPLLAGNRCYTLGLGGKLHCLDLGTGKPVWSRDLAQQFEISPPPFGIGPTPILEGDLLIVLVGGWPNSGVVAFRAATGDIVWQSVGQNTWQGADNGRPGRPFRWAGHHDLISYSSPLCATINGKRQLLCLMRQGLVSLDPRDGHLNYKFWFSPRNPTSVTAARPVVVEDDRIFLSGSYGAGGTLLEVDPSNRSAKELWHVGGLAAHWSTPIYRDGFLYGFTGREEPGGSLVCLDTKTGKQAWSTRGYEGSNENLALDPATGQVRDLKTKKIIPFPFFGRGSLTQAGTRFIILGERGTLALAELSPKGYHEICRGWIKGTAYPTWPSPVLAGKRLYLRDAKKVICLDLAPKRTKP